MVPALFALVLSLAGGTVGPVWADGHCDEDATVGPIGGEAGADCNEEGSSGGTAPECDPDDWEIAYYADPPPFDFPNEDEGDRWARIISQHPAPDGMAWLGAYNCAGRYLGGPHLVPDPNWVDTDALRQAARARVIPPLPEPNVSPGEAVVNVDTWLWVDDASWQERSAVESDGAMTVRVDARPVRVAWDLVEDIKVCDGPGIPWSQSAHDAYEEQPEHVRGTGNPACTFRFVNSSTTQPDGLYHASVTVTWEFSWWVSGAARGVFGTVDRTTEFDLQVGEIQAVITR